MSSPGFVISHPPIVEAVLDIECDLPITQELGELEQPALELFRDNYPNVQRQFVQQYELRATAGAPPDVSSHAGRPRIAALQFFQEDRKQLVQVRTQGFSFNRLAPYGSFDQYSEEIKHRWEQYRSITKPVQVIGIKLRYINRILVPAQNGCVELDDYFQISPRVPGEKEMTLTGFLQQYEAVDKKSGYRINLVLTPQRLEGDKLPVIFDNGVFADEKGDAKDWGWIMGTIQSLREQKNNIFRRSLTEKCLTLFQSP